MMELFSIGGHGVDCEQTSFAPCESGDHVVSQETSRMGACFEVVMYGVVGFVRIARTVDNRFCF